MKTLIIHHLERIWEESYMRIGGFSFEGLYELVREHIEENDYDRVILTQFEHTSLDREEGYASIAHLIDEVHEYGYGWELDGQFDSQIADDIFAKFNNNEIFKDVFNQEWIQGGNHSQIVLIDEWMRKLPKENVDICGAFDGECIEDLEIALTGAGVKFKRIEELII